MHSTVSDGKLTPTALVDSVHDAGIQLMALTDHDTTGGIDEAAKAAEKKGIAFVGGAEISSRENGEEVHLLAYGFDKSAPEFVDFLELQRQRRNERAVEFVSRFKDAGLLPSTAQAPTPAPGRAIARPHIASMLIDAGTVDSMEEAFRLHLSPGHDHFVEKPLPSGAEVVQKVHAAGGVVVLAHPGHRTSHQTLLKLVRGGLDGIEVFHPSHDESLSEYYSNQAALLGLFRTGGSDFHAFSENRSSTLGQYWIELEERVHEKLRTH